MQALDFADWAVRLITRPQIEKVTSDEWVPDGVRSVHNAAAAGRHDEWLERLRGQTDAIYARGSMRRLLAWTHRPITGEPLAEPVMKAVFPGPPPRAPGSLEWVRGILVELLDAYPVCPDRCAWRLVTDDDIALVSLLHAVLDELSATKSGAAHIARGTRHVLHREKKAISEARKRRGMLTRSVTEVVEAAVSAGAKVSEDGSRVAPHLAALARSKKSKVNPPRE